MSSIERPVFYLSAKKTEEEWANTWDAVYSEAVPALFRWASWSVLLGGLVAVEEVISSVALKIAIAVLSAGFLGHLTFAMSRPIYIWGAEGASENRVIRKREKLLTILIGFLLYLAVILIAIGTRDAITQFRDTAQLGPKESNSESK